MASTKLHFTIEDFRPEHKQRWKEINEDWVKEDFYMEDIDHQHCSHPESSILATGGQILIATVDGEAVGTAGLLRESDEVYELIKMAVDKGFRGYGIGRALCEAAIRRASELGIKVLYLYSNTRSAAALHLYRQFGFVETPMGKQEFERADIRMEMRFG